MPGPLGPDGALAFTGICDSTYLNRHYRRNACRSLLRISLRPLLRVFAGQEPASGATLTVTPRLRCGTKSGKPARRTTRGASVGRADRKDELMGPMTDQSGPADEYEAVALPVRSASSAVFVRRSARPTRRAVLHLHELTDSLAPADLVRWYNERGFHFYLTDVTTTEPEPSSRRRPTKVQPAAFSALDAACGYLKEADGIDAIILSAQGPTARVAALWCDARPVSRPVEAVILSNPDFGKERIRLDIACPVLVISAAGSWRGTRRELRGKESIRLGEHVTWLQIGGPGRAGSAGHRFGPPPQRRRLFDEMGRWLGAYMYGQVRDQLL